MIRISKEPVVWPVPWDKSRRYYFRAGDVLERADFEAEVAGLHRAGAVFPFHLSAEFANGVRALLSDSPDDAARLIEIEQLAGGLEEGEELSAEDIAALAQARDHIAQYWAPYGVLEAKDERRHQILPVLAFRRFCTGWEGKDLPKFALGPDGRVSMDSMAGLPGLDIRAGGSFAYGLLYGRSRDTKKNSDGPLPSGKGPKTSTSRSRKADGGSKGARTPRRTRSSGSRSGPSRS